MCIHVSIACVLLLLLVAKSYPTLCDPMECSLPGSSVREIFQARILQWVTISFFRGSSGPRDRTRTSCLAGGFFTTEPPWKLIVCVHIDQLR